MMKKVLFLLLGCCLLAAQDARADWVYPSHFLVIMPSDMVVGASEDPTIYDGVEFPLFCGIASAYPKENKFVFTKMTNLPIRRVEKQLRQIEKNGYLVIYGHPPFQEPVKGDEFFLAFLHWADIEGFKVFHVSNGQEVPLNVVPRFKRTCRYDSTKEPPTDCAYYRWEVTDLYIPFTKEEMEQIAKGHAQ